MNTDELARRMWGRYLFNEWRYDRFGAQGKFILLQEVLAETGAGLPPGLDPQRAVNAVFPRTFYCERRRPIGPDAAETIRKYFERLEGEFSEQDLPEHVVVEICFSETAEKFCLPMETLARIARYA